MYICGGSLALFSVHRDSGDLHLDLDLPDDAMSRYHEHAFKRDETFSPAASYYGTNVFSEVEEGNVREKNPVRALHPTGMCVSPLPLLSTPKRLSKATVEALKNTRKFFKPVSDDVADEYAQYVVLTFPFLFSFLCSLSPTFWTVTTGRSRRGRRSVAPPTTLIGSWFVSPLILTRAQIPPSSPA